jgi:hypothetical protein
MSNRTAKFVSAIFAGLLASVALTTESNSAAPAADDCLSGPKSPAPEGSHWYYRIDRVTKRHCWYLGEEREKHSRAAPQNSAPSENPVSLWKETATQPSHADAHAELPLPPTPVKREASAAAWTPAMIASAASAGNSRAASNTWDASTRRSVVASRWPEQSGMSSSATPEPTSDNSDAPASDAPAQSNSAASPLPGVAAVPLTAADASSERPFQSEKQAGSIQMLLIIIFGALSFAGLMGSAIFRFGNLPRPGRPRIRGDRRGIWDLADADRPTAITHLRADHPQTDYPRADPSMRRVDVARELPMADDPNGKILEMLARLQRSAAG